MSNIFSGTGCYAFFSTMYAFCVLMCSKMCIICPKRLRFHSPGEGSTSSEEDSSDEDAGVHKIYQSGRDEWEHDIGKVMHDSVMVSAGQVEHDIRKVMHDIRKVMNDIRKVMLDIRKVMHISKVMHINKELLLLLLLLKSAAQNQVEKQICL